MRKIFLLVLTVMVSISAFAFPGTQKVTAKIERDQIVVTFHIPEKMHQILQKEYFKLEVEPIKGFKFGKTVYPDTAITGTLGKEYHGETKLTRKIVRVGQVNSKSVKVTAFYQLCDEKGACMMPQKTSFELTIPKDLLSNEKISSLKEINGSSNNSAVSGSNSSGPELLYMLLLAFLGGVILNLMPCVLPVLSIKMMSIVNSAHQGRKEIMKGGLLYTAGVLLSFAILALAVIALKMSGEAVGWGFQFQNKYFVFALFVLIWGFALSLFDVFVIEAPGMQVATKASSSHGAMGTFMSGVFAVLLATPCTAPMLGTAIGFAFKQSPPVIFIMMLAVGFGLALPFTLLGFVPAIMKLVPKPGNWMNTFREVMGFLLFGTAIFIARSLSFLLDASQFINFLWYVLVLTIAFWLYGKSNKPQHSKHKQWLGTILAVMLAVGGGYALLFKTHSSWESFSEERLTQLRDENKPVFVDFGAEWCMTCKMNESLVLNTDDIQLAFKERGVTLLYGDFTKKSPLILSWLHKYDRSGVPLYLLFKPGEEKPVIFPEILSKKVITDTLETLDDKNKN